MNEVKNIIAFDCSNSSIRTILGKYDGEKIETELIMQTPNRMIKMGEYYYWDIMGIYQSMLSGLKLAASEVKRIESIGICTWGIDFAFFTEEGNMLSNPLAYRNTLGADVLSGISKYEQNSLFEETGILCDKINSIYMVMAIKEHMPSLMKTAHKFLTIPDILNFLFTGIMINEPSEFSTTQFMDVRGGRVSQKACDFAGLSTDVFPGLGSHGTRIGNLQSSVAEQINIDYKIPVICVPSHDTASAVLGLPAVEDSFNFISSGTWSLIGTELRHPIVNESVRKSCLTNELGAFGRTTLLKNNAGMFIVQRLKEENGHDDEWEDFYSFNQCDADEIPIFDVNDERFFNPDNMSSAIWSYLTGNGKVTGEFDLALTIESFLHSMAYSYSEGIRQVESVKGKSADEIYIMGGGVKNTKLCQLTADYANKKVVAGSSESTSYGNMAAQIKYLNPEKTIDDLRTLIKGSIECREFYPNKII